MEQKPLLSRRELLKLLSLTPLLALPGASSNGLSINTDSDSPNIVILVFDTWSASHMPFYGYPRNTMPSLSKFLDRATVYHSHYSTSNFTTPGTASIFTSRYPWNHRAFNLYGEIIKDEVPNNIFTALTGTPYTRLGFSQNPLAIFLMEQFDRDLDLFPMPDETALVDYFLSDDIFSNDIRTASIVETAYLRPPADKPLSFFFSLIDKYIENQDLREFNAQYKEQYPIGTVGHPGRRYLLSEMMDWVKNTVVNLPQPTMAYIHLWPPHDPYRPNVEFLDTFSDGWTPVEKPQHYFSDEYSQDTLNERRQRYDEFIANIDDELGKILTAWDESGVLDNTILMLTSDHGEMFERGNHGHLGTTLFEPVIKIPLIISEPGQTERKDIYAPTSNVDLLPTIMNIVGEPVPEWCEGVVLPPFSASDPDRSIFAIENRTTPILAPIEQGTLVAIRGNYKLIYYMGYDMDAGSIELFDLDNDPEELENLAGRYPAIAEELKKEILIHIRQSNKLYQK
jgi:arylsulfatase A-like enzyme